MSYKITEDYISCGACEAECKNDAISEGETSYIIDPNRCTECVGNHDSPRCAETCPRQAISLQLGLTQIDQNRCNHCGLCLDVCPQGAITELTPVSRRELQATVTGLRDKTEDVITRIEKLKERQRRI